MYEVPIIPNNLRHEETIVQVADALTYLQDVFDDMIVRVNVRIEKNKSYLSELSQRINKSTEKVNKLIGTKKATQIFSSSKYPAADIHKNYKSLFSNVETNINFKRTRIKYKCLELSDHPLEKLQFYHVKYDKKNNYTKVEEGLGSYHSGINSINELVLFNTSKNPYRNYVMSDPLQVPQSTREVDELKYLGPDAAPLSISQRAALNRSIGENYFYSPGLGDVPVIDVPLDLPDLPGIADDLRYAMETDPAIAPSVTTTPNVPDLPSVMQSPTETSVSEINVVEEEKSVTLPQLLSPLKQMSPVENTNINVVPEIVDIINVSEVQVGITSKETETHTSLPVIEDAHASLMAAIRKAGGIKNAKLRNTESKKENKSAMNGNNLIADLSAKLALRRKGISGTKTNDGFEMNSALSRISAMIPPPLPPSGNELNTEDEDWDE